MKLENTLLNEPEEINCSHGLTGIGRHPFKVKVTSSSLVGSTNMNKVPK